MILIRHHNEGNQIPFFYYALEDYVLNTLLKNDETYFFTWEITGIIVGKNQVIENEVNLDYVKAHQIPVYRRPTGGGAVYADHRNTMFSIITKRKNREFSFKDYLVKIIEAFKKIGLNLEFSGRNDILLDGKKISGNSFLQNKNGMLMHGTLMYDTDVETMVRALSPNDEKLISKGIASVRSRVTNIKAYLNGMTQAEMIRHLENDMTDTIYELSEDEVKMLNENAKKYDTYAWNYLQQPAFKNRLKKRMPWGVVEVSMDLNYGIIEAFKMQGDFFHKRDDLDVFENQFIGKSYDYQTISHILRKGLKISDYILDATVEDLDLLFKEALPKV